MIKRICKDCGKEFTISDSEIDFYKNKNLELPKRCKECRNKNKNKKKDYREVEKIEVKNENKIGGKKTFRNVIIAAIILVASLLGLNFNEIWSDISNRNTNQSTVQQNYSLTFRNDKLLQEHFEKHGSEFNYKNEDQYLKGANEVVNASSSKHKVEAEDGDEIYYDEDKNEIVFLSKDGYIRTYFKPSDGIKYYNRQ